jgi:type I restriction enzyme S subunit
MILNHEDTKSRRKYKAYPSYKDSGVAWLGSVPSHWSSVRFKRVLFEKKKTLNPNLEAGSISFGRVIYKNSENLALETKESYQEVLEGEFLINPLNMNYDLLSLRTALSSINVVVSTGYIVVKNDECLDKRYVRWLLQEFDVAHMKTLGSGVRQTINYTDIGNSFFFEPLLEEQKKIANFLDHETAKIDLLIEKQQQLIQLLKEKRQAVISHAVTKGLNPKTPMKDSGVEWLGEVPEHWEMVPLKYLCKFSGGGTPSKDNLEYWTGGDIPWVSPKDMKTFWVSDTQDKLTKKAVDESSTNFVEEGALLMVVRSGILQRTIPIAINTVRVTLNQDMKALKFNSRMNVEYVANFILGFVGSLLLEWSKEGATVESIEQEYLSNSLFPVPTIEEQLNVNKVVNEQMTIFQNIEERTVRGIALLKERRTALISAAVTGKIDVRDWQAPKG